MTGLLVSVRSADEAQAALAGGASIIDVKEPAHGSLGAAHPGIWREVATAVAGKTQLSAALGELTDEDRPDPELLGPQYQFAKLGLAGCAKLVDWPARWAAALALLPPQTVGVAVVYADWCLAQSPEPAIVLEYAQAVGCRVLLVDTFDKSGGDLFSHLSCAELRQLVDCARAAGMRVVLAGSLTAESLPQALQLSPDLVAVRGAVCRGTRVGTVDANLVRNCVARMDALNRGLHYEIA